MLQPNLALLVHSLDIDIRWCEGKDPTGLDSDSKGCRLLINALSSAKSVKSLGVSGVAWLWGNDMKPVRDVVSKMRLESLRIYEWWPDVQDQQVEHQEDVFTNLRTVLQGQLSLQALQVDYFLCKRGADYRGSFPLGIQSSHIPNLRTLRADAATVASILPVVGDQLDSLEIVNWKNSNHRFLVESFSGLAAARGQIRKLHLSMQWIALRGWGFDLGKVLELFPNVESLKITGGGGLSARTLPMLWEAYFEAVPAHVRSRGFSLTQSILPISYFIQVASQISNSRNLIRLEMSLEFETEWGRTDFEDPEARLMLNLKRSCPTLETFISPGQQEWTFLPPKEKGSDAVQVARVGRFYHAASRFTAGDLEALGVDA
ncbi:hypothetical protein FS837_012300 [Tulasnella sp. UAMH 9824]|nr:hypothetical protein FS837_012300 [Tulasnella sp. UAMH 9824]